MGRTGSERFWNQAMCDKVKWIDFPSICIGVILWSYPIPAGRRYGVLVAYGIQQGVCYDGDSDFC